MVDFDAYRRRKDVLFRELSVATNLACLTGALRFTAIEATGCMTALRIDYGLKSTSVNLDPDKDDWAKLVDSALNTVCVPERAVGDFMATLERGLANGSRAPVFAYNAPPQTPLDQTAAMERLRHAVRDAPGNTGYARSSVYVEDVKLALDAWASVVMLELLRKDEGASVTVLCDNPEAVSADVQCAVEISDDWTDWEPKRFYGRDIGTCLKQAIEAKGAAR